MDLSERAVDAARAALDQARDLEDLLAMLDAASARVTAGESAETVAAWALLLIGDPTKTEPEALGHAAALLARASALAAADSPLRPLLLNAVGGACLARGDLDAAVAAFSAVAGATTLGSEERRQARHGWGVALIDRYEASRTLDDLFAGLELLERVVAERPDRGVEPTDREPVIDYARALGLAHRATGDADHLRRAIGRLHAVLEGAPDDGVWRRRVVSELADLLLQTGEWAATDEATWLLRQALQSAPPRDAEYLLVQLANTQRFGFEQSGQTQLLDAAVRSLAAAQQLGPPRPQLLARFAEVLARRYHVTGDASDRLSAARAALKARALEGRLTPRELAGAVDEVTQRLRGESVDLEARFLNLVVQERESAEPITTDAPLLLATEYDLELSIGQRLDASVLRGGVEFPAGQLPESERGHRLTIALTSASFAVPDDAFELFLPPHGDSAAVRVPVRAPEVEGPASLRVAVYFQNNVVQSLLLTADIVAEASDAGAHAAEIDFTLGHDLRAIGELAPRALSVLVNERPDGTHTLHFQDHPEHRLSFTLSEGHLTNAMADVRRALLGMHAEAHDGALRSRLSATNGKAPKQFVEDLVELAELGAGYYEALFAQRGMTLDLAVESAARTIQVARVPSSLFVFPWAAVYDLPLDYGDGAVREPCPLVAEWDGRQPLFDGFPTECPRQQAHTKNTICPFGFWGFRYVIEHPPSTDRSALPVAIRVLGSPELALARSLDLDAAVTQVHVENLHERIGHVDVHDACSLSALAGALARCHLDIAYFYCHGVRTENGGECLEIGAGERLFPGQLVTWRRHDWRKLADHWLPSGPLVVLNGCHTAELTPQSPVNFVDTFSAAGAAGVVGTEIAFEQRMASEAGEMLLDHFAGPDRVPIGEALRRLRLHFLVKGNLLGLGYSAYCSADLRLVA